MTRGRSIHTRSELRTDGTIRAWWLAGRSKLRPSERVAEGWEYVWLNKWWGQSHGNLYLTNQRLIWFKWRFSPPFGPRSIDVELDHVREVAVKRRMADFIYKSVTLKLADGSAKRFVSRGQTADDVAGTLERAVRPNGNLQ